MLTQMRTRVVFAILLAGAMVGASLSYVAERMGLSGRVAIASESRCTPENIQKEGDIIFVGCGGFF